MKLIKSKTNLIHISRNESDVSLCGQVPWTEPVKRYEGSIEEVTCKRCKTKGELTS